MIRDALREQPLVLPMIAAALILLIAQLVGALIGWL